MKKNRWLLRLIALLALSGALMTTATLAAGSPEDPLVTLSYLNNTFLNTVLQRVDQKIAQYTGVPGSGGSGTASSFAVVTLSEGQALTGDIGCEVLLRVGSAVCSAPSEPGLVDETSGETLANGGALAQNHLYLLTIAGRGVRASAGTVKLLVRGSYSIT